MSTLDELLGEAVRIHVAKVPLPLPAHRRIIWLLGASQLVLDKSWAKSSTLEQLHLVVWAMKSPTTRAMFSAWWRGEIVPGVASARFEPLLPIVMSIAASDELVEFTSTGRYRLIGRGRMLVRELQRNEDAYAVEKDFLADIPGAISTAAITRKLEQLT